MIIEYYSLGLYVFSSTNWVTVGLLVIARVETAGGELDSKSRERALREQRRIQRVNREEVVM